VLDSWALDVMPDCAEEEAPSGATTVEVLVDAADALLPGAADEPEEPEELALEATDELDAAEEPLV